MGANNQLFAEGAKKLGLHPYSTPRAVLSAPYGGRPPCNYCGYCGNYGCEIGAKSSVLAAFIPRAEATGHLTVETSARVLHIDVDADGLVAGATYVQNGRQRFQPARAVLLGTFVYENTRLLLLSRSAAYPDGLSNNHGQVGRHFMAHVTPVVFGAFPGRRLNLFSGLWAQATCVDDWNADNFDHSGLGFVGGALLTAAHELKPVAFASGPVPPSVPRWGSAWKAWLMANAQSVGAVVAQMENLSYEENVLDLDPVTTDPEGVPVVRVTHRLRENELRGHDFMVEKLETWLRAAGASETWAADLFVEARHAYGGTRMGDDPETSVVDRYGFSHEAPNLGVLGASTFPTTGGLNPTLTLQALAWRTAQRLVDGWRAIARDP